MKYACCGGSGGDLSQLLKWLWSVGEPQSSCLAVM